MIKTFSMHTAEVAAKNTFLTVSCILYITKEANLRCQNVFTDQLKVQFNFMLNACLIVYTWHMPEIFSLDT